MTKKQRKSYDMASLSPHAEACSCMAGLMLKLQQTGVPAMWSNRRDLWVKK
jgi:hypothetical protein